jgi:hypothetical protein
MPFTSGKKNAGASKTQYRHLDVPGAARAQTLADFNRNFGPDSLPGDIRPRDGYAAAGEKHELTVPA